MTIHVNQQEAKKQFSHLLSQVLQGEEIIISVGDQEIARLIPSAPNRVATSSKVSLVRVPGIDEGRFVVPDDFDDPLPPDILKAFESEN